MGFGSAPGQYEATITIAAVNKTLFVDFQKDAGMAQRSASGNIGRAIAGDAAGFDGDYFRRVGHGARIATGGAGFN